MNREIKFRGKCSTSKEWLYGYLFLERNTFLEIEQFIICEGASHPHNTGKTVFIESVGEFIGLKDRHDNDIYEGDIIKLDHWEPKIYQVGFNRGGFCFYNEGDNFYNDAKYLENGIIIGNIFENPELLK